MIRLPTAEGCTLRISGRCVDSEVRHCVNLQFLDEGIPLDLLSVGHCFVDHTSYSKGQHRSQMGCYLTTPDKIPRLTLEGKKSHFEHADKKGGSSFHGRASHVWRTDGAAAASKRHSAKKGKRGGGGKRKGSQNERSFRT